MLKLYFKLKKTIIILVLIFSAPLCLMAESNNVLFMTMPDGDIELDPAHAYLATEAQLFTALYEGLVTYHPLTLEPIPAAASRWTISPDGRVYTFYLQPNGSYWNGETVLAEDFRDAWFRMLDPEEKAEFSFLFDPIKGATDYRNGKIISKEEVGIKVIDYLTLEVTLKEPANYFLKVLCHHCFSPLNKLNLENGTWKNGPTCLGNGPFILYSQSDDLMILKKNIFYWDEENVSLSEIHIVLTNDAEAVTEQFNKDEILWVTTDFIYDKITEKDNIITNPLFGTTYFYFATRQDALKNPEVRRALCLMLPWDKIRNENIFYIPTATLVPPINGYPELEGINKRNIKEALKLLHKAGFTGGKGLETLKITIPDFKNRVYIAEIMKQTWEKFLEVDVEINNLDYNNYYYETKKDNYSITTNSWIGDFADPLAFLQMWTSDSNLNDSGYKNPEYDRLLKKSLVEKDIKKRYELMAEAEKIILEDGLVIPIQTNPAFNAVNTRKMRGWLPNVLDIHPFKFFSIRQEEIPKGTG